MILGHSLKKLETHYLNDTVLQVYYVNDSLYQTSTYVFEGQSYAQHSLDSAFHGHSGGDSTYYVTNYSQFESGFLEKRSSSPGRHGYNPWETHSHLYRYSWSGTQEEIIWKYHDNLQVTPKSISGPSWSQTNVPLTRLWPLIDTMRYDIMYLQNSIIRKQLTKLPSASGRHFTDPTPDLVYIRFNYRLDNVKRVIKRTNILLEGDNSLGNDNYIEKEVFHYSYFY